MGVLRDGYYLKITCVDSVESTTSGKCEGQSRKNAITWEDSSKTEEFQFPNFIFLV